MTASVSPPLLSIVVPLYNEEQNIEPLYQRLKAALSPLDLRHELILVDNGSRDHTLAILKRLASLDPCVTYLTLSRNFGHQGGLVAGLEHARGEVVVSLDGDLQHPPEFIPSMIAQWRLGFDVVYTLKRDDRSISFLRKQTNILFYRLMSRLSGLNITVGQSDFRLMNRAALDAMLALPERTRFLRGLAQWIGFRQIGLEFQVERRHAGSSKYRFKDLVNFAINGIFSFSILPLRLFTLIGSGVSLLALGYAAYNLLITWYKQFMDIPTVAGYPTLSVGIFFLGGVQLIGIGLLGEYLGKVYDEVKQRPTYILRERSTPRETPEERPA